MKNLFVILILSISFFSLNAQNDAYHEAMKDAIHTLHNAKNGAELMTVKNKFERIAQMKSDDWLPLYYLGMANVYLSFHNSENKDELADVALSIVEKASKLATDHVDQAEIFALQGLVYVAKLLVDPMSRGQKYGMLSNQSYGKSLALDSNNPRAKLLQIESGMGAAQFLKQDIQPFYTQAKELLTKWDDFSIKSDIHPNWGKSRVQNLAAQAKGDKVTVNEDLKKVETISETDENAIHFEITGLKSSKGHILLSLMNDKEEVILKKALTISDKSVTDIFSDLEPGKYAIRYIHDENDDKKMNTGTFGIPSEGYGASNDARGTFGPPAFADMIFSVSGTTKIVMKTKYH